MGWTGHGADRAAFADRLRAFCHEVGFIQLVDHGVGPSFLGDYFGAQRPFFALSDDVTARIDEAGVNAHHDAGVVTLMGHHGVGGLQEQNQVASGSTSPLTATRSSSTSASAVHRVEGLSHDCRGSDGRGRHRPHLLARRRGTRP